MRIRRKFIKLTSETYPHGYEKALRNKLPKGVMEDAFGNFMILIGDDPNTMFTSHLDTASSRKNKVNHVFENGGKIIKTDGTTILGADCKAGVVVMMYMIEKKIPGLYYFFLGEEVGCLGSRWLAKKMYKYKLFESINKVISFDRNGTDSIITHQWGGRCCSDKFADALSNEMKEVNNLRMSKDSTGICTDSIQFQEFIPECTNISVGYYNEHQKSESQDIEFLTKLCKTVVKIDWENLPIDRDPYVIEEYEWTDNYESYSHNNDTKKTFSSSYYTYTVDKYVGKRVKVYVSHERIAYEINIIKNILKSFQLDVEYDDIDWDGENLILSEENSLGRNYLSTFDNRLGTVKAEDLRYSLPTRRKGKRHKRKINKFNEIDPMTEEDTLLPF